MNCAISPLGCEFLTRSLDPRLGSTLSVLKLDYNPEIGDAGIAILAECLMRNKVSGNSIVIVYFFSLLLYNHKQWFFTFFNSYVSFLSTPANLRTKN